MEKRLVTQKSWGWRIATYLFLAGLGSGSALVGIAYGFLFKYPSAVAKVGLTMGPPFVMMGCIFLLLDLGRPSFSYLMMRRPKDSWIARGFFILSGFILIGLIDIVLWIGPWPLIKDWSSLWNFLGCVVTVFAVLTSIYPALLLGYFPIPLWNTPILPVLFLVSSASMGIAAIILWMVHALGFPSQEVSLLLRLDALLIVSEIFLLILYFHGMNLFKTAKISARNILVGRFAPLFWGGVVLIGLVIPFVLEMVGSWPLVPTLCVLIGGYLLRYIIVMGGIKIPLSVQGVIIPIPGKN